MIPVLDTPAAMTAQSLRWKGEGLTIGLVPTMGALHEGHVSLVRAALARCDRVVASIFVNPLQFGPGEDYERYPRDLAADLARLQDVGCHAVFHAPAEALYPPGFTTHVVNETLAARFEGAVRPQHFRGVLTVVAKLFGIVRPDVAYFGRKDAQQSVLVRRMAQDLDLPVEIAVRPTVREADGLALSSRNVFLDETARARAVALSRGLFAAAAAWDDGERRAAELVRVCRAELERESGVAIDYVALVDPDTLADPAPVVDRGLLLVAARVGGVRLIDNCLLPEDAS